MSLITCSDCKREVSTNAEACPNCGNPIKTSSNGVISFIISVLIIAGGGYIYSTHILGKEQVKRIAAKIIKAPITIRDEIISVESTQIQGRPISLTQTGILDINVDLIRGKHINVYLVDQDDWGPISEAKTSLFGGKYSHYEMFHAEKTKIMKRSGPMGAGQYYLVIHNPTLGILVDSSFDVKVKVVFTPN